MKNGDKIPIIKYFFKIGYFLQKYIVTSEPTDIQLNAAVEAMKKLLTLEEEFNKTPMQKLIDALPQNIGDIKYHMLDAVYLHPLSEKVNENGIAHIWQSYTGQRNGIFAVEHYTSYTSSDYDYFLAEPAKDA